MIIDAGKEALEGHAVVEVLARMDFIGEIDALFVEGVEDRPPAFRELAERLLDQSRRALRPRIEIGPGERARKTRMGRSEEHTSELQSLMRISYAAFCLKKKRQQYTHDN